MFSGIVQDCAAISQLVPMAYGLRLDIDVPVGFQAGVNMGASVAVNGVCLTVAGIEEGRLTFDVIHATLARTNLGQCAVGGRVNVERSLPLGGEIGGHPVSGHVSCVATVIEMNDDPAGAHADFLVAQEWQRYIFPRGFVALNGCSLTVADIDDMGIHRVYLIPETLQRTNLADYKPGDTLNLEIDQQSMIIVDTIERCLQGKRLR